MTTVPMATKLSRTATYLDLLLLIKVPFEFNMKMLLITEWNEAEEKNILFLSIL